MKKRKQVTASCDNCGVSFNRAESEVKRSKKLGRKIFCSRSCSGHNNLPNFGDRINTGAFNKPRETSNHTGFNHLLRSARKRNAGCYLTIEDLADVWSRQNGVCVYSGVKLIPPRYNRVNPNINTMSLDRIDSSKPYTKDNIQFVSIAMNHLKNDQTHEEMLEILALLKH